MISKFSIISLLVSWVIFIGCTHTKEKNEQQLLLGVKIYDYDGDFKSLFASWEEIGINTVFASVDLLSNSQFKQLSIENNIKTFVILPIFYAPEETTKDSTVYAITNEGKYAEDEWVKFACPSHKEFRQSRINFIREFVKTHNPDVLSLDFIRHFAFWEKIYPNTPIDSIPNSCFDQRCVNAFYKNQNINVDVNVKTPAQIYQWIRSNYWEEWIKWKCDLITSMVNEIVNAAKEVDPEIEINLHAVPWRERDFDGSILKIIGQDFSSLSKHLNYISPMTYAHMVKQDPDWITGVVSELFQETNLKVIPSIQVDKAYLDNKLTNDEFQKNLNAALKSPSRGVIIWNWNKLVANKDKLEIFKSTIQ